MAADNRVDELWISGKEFSTFSTQFELLFCLVAKKSLNAAGQAFGQIFAFDSAYNIRVELQSNIAI